MEFAKSERALLTNGFLFNLQHNYCISISLLLSVWRCKRGFGPRNPKLDRAWCLSPLLDMGHGMHASMLLLAFKAK